MSLQTKQAAVAINTVAAGPAFNVAGLLPGDAGQRDLIATGINIVGGTTRTVQWQASFDGTVWFNIGTSRTTTGVFFENIPLVPFLRLNVSVNTGTSVIDAWFAV